MNKKLTIILAVIAAIALVGFVVYALVTSNTITITPQATTILLTANNYAPAFGDTVTLTATLADPVSGVVVTFYANTVDIGDSTTTAGVATLPLLIDGLAPIYVYCTIP